MEQFRNELSEALCYLLTDSSRLSDFQLEALTTLLQRTMKARKEGLGPIDYNQPRQTALLVVEYALGKELILKETADQQMKLLRERNYELLFDRTGKLAEERKRLEREKAEFDSEKKRFSSQKAAFEEASGERLVTIVLDRFRSGLIQSHTCQNCGSAIAYQRGQNAYATELLGCPFCMGSLRRRNKWPE
jgi:hypothetical protein